MFRIKKLWKMGTGFGFVLIALLEIPAQSGDGYLARGRAVQRRKARRRRRLYVKARGEAERTPGVWSGFHASLTATSRFY
ncbi:MAG TPA: hypothetical protein PKO33_05695 [Pyrinomonadaceae bacterium]|nr:hypothetical protein [Pyrinomonadaceae bacterium]